ncbi:branched-chain amino acid ABC transporter permease [Nocardioides sp. GXZ039]|uniref:branched-chain amino acid ABC transporter permease n=1 Tax=Nocardioides sp. GXZ039 TaxID=3136018 RepID=UPI0030F45F8C
MDVFVQALFSGLLEAGLLMAVSVGLALVFGVMGVVNFAHGALLMVAMYVAIEVGDLGSIWITMLLLFAIMAIAGGVVYLALIRPAYHLDHTFQLLITLGLAVVLENAALLYFGAQPRSRPDAGIDGSLRILGAALPWNRVALAAIGVAITIALYLFITRSELGQQIRAASQDTMAAQLSGISVQKVLAVAMAMGIGVLGLIAPFLVTTTSVSPTLGDRFVLLAFVVVILGGAGSIRGAAIAAVIVGLTETLGAAYLPGTLGLSAVWILFVLVLLFRPQGLMGNRV